MKKNSLVVLGVLLAFVLLLAACQQAPDAPSETTVSPAVTTAEPENQAPATEEQTTIPETTTPEETTEAETEQKELVINAEEEGRILVAYYKNNDPEKPASDSVYHSAQNFSKILLAKTGLTVKVTRVRNTGSNPAVTFLIGDTPYEETALVKESLPENSYAMQLVGRKIVIVGTDPALTVKALKTFCDQVLNNPERVSDGCITVYPEDAFTVTLDQPYTVSDMMADGLNVTADYAELFHSSPYGQYGIAQGAATDGTYIYVALRNADDTGSVIIKHRMDDGSFVAKSEVLDLGHANDMTYNTAKNLLVVAHGQKEGKILTIVNPETLEFIEDVNIEKGAGAITYNPATNTYAISQGGKSLHMLDADLTYVISFDRTKPSGYTAQGMGSDEKFIYFPMSGSGQNILDTYDWEGNPITHIILPTPYESESLFYVNGRYFVNFNHQGAVVFEIFFRCVLPKE